MISDVFWPEDPLPVDMVCIDLPLSPDGRIVVPRSMRRPLSAWLTSQARTDRINSVLSIVRRMKCRCRRGKTCAPCQARALRTRDYEARLPKRLYRKRAA